ncbi:glycosyltransferase [Salmonella enterica subsp. enterica serovar Mbandaka]|nr:glycosyltransferase [Salmonella enterica subsp. enterica serovar Mbandaka]
MEKSKILILTPRFPYPVVGGDRLRIYRICKELSKYYTLDLLSLCDSIEDLNFIVKNDHVFDKIFRIYHPKIKSYFNVLKALPGRKPLQIAYYKNTEFENKLNEIIGNYDLTLSHLIRVGDYTLNKPGLHILEMTDAISLNYSRIKKEAPKNSLKSIIYSIEQERLLKYEKEVYGRYSLISLISEVDKKFLFGNRNDNILVCNNGVDLEDYPFTKRVIENTNIINLIFIGNLCSFQNFDGVKWFVKNILPSINKNNNGKQYIFHILGKINKSDKLYLQGFENVVVSGSVTNMADAAKIGHIGICPVRFGAGVQNKILEYMALGLPTITSRMGYEGIEANIGEEILIADNSDEYMKSLETLSENSVYQMIAKNARNFVAEKFNWSTRLSVLVKNIERLTGK